MQKMLDILNKAGGEASKEVMVKDLQELSEKAFTYKNKLQQLTKDIDEFAKADDKKLSFGKIMR
ncbi:hypothetical protein, partial [Klebsiella pneumoniae]